MKTNENKKKTQWINTEYKKEKTRWIQPEYKMNTEWTQNESNINT